MIVRRVVLDPGHGGVDPGAVSDDLPGVFEKAPALDIAKKVAAYFAQAKLTNLALAEARIDALLTRDDDRYVSLADRVKFANDAGADLFVSIHHNSRPTALPETKPFEIEGFWCPQSKVAGYSAASFCLIQIERKVKISFPRVALANRGVNDAGFYVIKHTAMPSCLLELGFMVDRDDAGLLQDDAFRKVLADGIAAGIEEHLGMLP